MSRLSPAKLRMAGLGTAVAIAVLVPLAARAGQPDAAPSAPSAAPRASAADGKADAGTDATGDERADAGPEGRTGGTAATGGGAGPGGDTAGGTAAGEPGGGLLDGLGLGREARTPGSAGDAGEARPSAAAPAPGRSAVAAAAGHERVSRCGPELASPEGVEAQTCVLSEGPDVWARTYYRNATGREIDAILTLMAPGGRTVQVRCAVPARDEPDTCETPREPGTGAARSHTAVAEFARSGEGGDAPLLLRSGSNTADGEAS
ncbi:hypothetical protein [Streptomyces omiyaensis]|uniref:hypothetical protein n=1 Tax=Streptomyces omiyaensis TaxID=68247 RepID=UPI0037016F44